MQRADSQFDIRNSTFAIVIAVAISSADGAERKQPQMDTDEHR